MQKKIMMDKQSWPNSKKNHQTHTASISLRLLLIPSYVYMGETKKKNLLKVLWTGLWELSEREHYHITKKPVVWWRRDFSSKGKLSKKITNYFEMHPLSLWSLNYCDIQCGIMAIVHASCMNVCDHLINSNLSRMEAIWVW